MDDISEMLKSVMSDPEAMSKLMSVAQGLTNNEKQESAPEPPPEKAPEKKLTFSGNLH